MLNATWLETFTVLAETGHFTRAAERLNMTQPGVSQQLRRLEAQVGCALIAQEGKRFDLTDAGVAVHALGVSRRVQERDLREMITADDPDSGSVRIACSGGFATLLLGRVLEIMRAAPDLLIHIEAAPQAAVRDGVLAGRFDLGVAARDPGHPRLDARQIGAEELCLLLPRDGDTGPVTFDDLERRGMIGHPDGAAYADDLFGANFPDAYTGADRLRLRGFVNQIGQIPEPVASGIGYTLLPRSGVDAYAHRDALRVVTLPHRAFHELWLIRRSTGPKAARLTRIADLIRDLAQTLAPA